MSDENPPRNTEPAKLTRVFDSNVTSTPPKPAADLNSTANPDSAGKKPRAHIGIEIAGYRVLREISRGGQAIVFEAVQESTGQRVAIKVLKEGVFSSPDELNRFDREVQLLVALQHPDIVRVIDRGQTPAGLRFLVMEFIHGRALDQHVDARRERGDFDPVDLLKLFLRIAEAVNAAHLRGIVHRDLKPANICVDPEGNPHILDFGVARGGGTSVELGVTVSGDFIGSLPWASPEQADGLSDKVDPRSDVYSLGVILYQMLTGTFPYQVVGTMRDVLNNILTAQPQPPSEVLAKKAAK